MLALPAIATARPLVIGGLGIGETAYPHPASRHTGVATFMLAAGTALPRVALAMKSAGYRVRQGRRAHYWPFLHWALISAVHPSGFQVFLQSAPPWRQSRRPGHAELLRGARQVHCAEGLSFATPGIEDAMALVAAGIGVERNPLSLVAAVDCALLLQSLASTTERTPTSVQVGRGSALGTARIRAKDNYARRGACACLTRRTAFRSFCGNGRTRGSCTSFSTFPPTP
jgi:hypothetical protein